MLSVVVGLYASTAMMTDNLERWKEATEGNHEHPVELSTSQMQVYIVAARPDCSLNEDNIKVDHKETGCESTDRVHWRTSVCTEDGNAGNCLGG
jgi:hypothetical protein